jgi:acyl-CoA reductase-like NAD-dependent aldehyde dehydrogenase
MAYRYPMHIAGEPVRSDRTQTVELPFDGSAVGTIFEATPSQVDAAVDAAKQAAPLMREMTRDERASVLRRVHYKMLERREELSFDICNETGKPIKEARIEVDRAAATILHSSAEALRLVGEVIPLDAAPAGKGRWGMTVREPLGVIAAITPFNVPLNLAMHKIGPAIAGGNTIVHKPASATPISALKMAEIFAECGLPKGALNVITGPGGTIGEQLVFHKDVAMITFTGSVEIGMKIRNLAGLKRVTLELGGNSAVILAEDADFDAALPRCVGGSFAHSGQLCISVQRIYVHESRRDEFVERFVEGTKRLVIGHPHDAQTDISSLIDPKEAERIVSWIGEAIRSGAKLAHGGGRSRATIEPAVVTDVPDNVPLSCKEAFGPVVAVNSYKSLDEAIGRVNDSEFGLQAGIYTRDMERAFWAAQRVHVGGFMINEVPQYRVDHMPYGGVKNSGTGREGPKYALEEMTEAKLITWRV